jgi:hypothetical protein
MYFPVVLAAVACDGAAMIVQNPERRVLASKQRMKKQSKSSPRKELSLSLADGVQ